MNAQVVTDVTVHVADLDEFRDLIEALAAWSEFYDDIHSFDDGERYMTQLDHGHDEYEARLRVMAAARLLAEKAAER